MFQTEPIIFLQSFSTPALDAFFHFITSLGYAAFVRPFIIVVIFGFNFRMGFLLLQLIMINVIATMELKEVFGLPRPFNVDAAVKLPGGGNGQLTPLRGMGAADFWGGLPQQAIDYFRTHRGNSWGFPSGHTSSAVVIWGGLASIFKKPWVTAACILLIILIPFSRLYLGRHFIADVLGGFFLGGALLLIFYLAVFDNQSLHRFLFDRMSRHARHRKKEAALIGAGVGLPALLAMLNISPANSAAWAGINGGFLLVRLRGVPDDSGTLITRVARVAVAGLMFYLLDQVFDWFAGAVYLQTGPAAGALSAIKIALFVWISTETEIRLGWMKRSGAGKNPSFAEESEALFSK